MPNIFDYVNAREIATYYTANPSLAVPYLGAQLFPAKKQLGLTLGWLKGSRGLPIALKPSAFDTKATLRDRIGFSSVETEMPFFKEGMRIGEKDRQELNKAMMAANAGYLMPILNNIYDDVAGLVAGADVQFERMRMQLLSTGKISVVANRVAYDYDYKMPAAHLETLVTKWSDLNNATPVQDIQRWQDQVETDTGVRPGRAICTKKTWNYLLQNKSIRLDMNPIGGQNIIMTDAVLKAYLSNKLNITVAVYNKFFQYEDNLGAMQTAQFFPDDLFTLIPEGALGNTYFGTTPEESDLMTGADDVQVSIINTGVAITSTKESDPVNVFTKVSAIALPSFETIDKIFIATVN